MSKARKIKIAIVQSSGGETTVVGPDDYKPDEFPTAMEAAICWHLERGEVPVAKYWITTTLPAPHEQIPEIKASAEDAEKAKQPGSLKDLTQSQVDVLREMGAEWAQAPYAGWHRRQGQVAKNLVDKGIAEMREAGDKGSYEFRLTELGHEFQMLSMGKTPRF